MKKIYINLFSFILLVLLAGISNDAKAQKNLKLRITRIEAANTAGTDCDANCLNTSDNQIDWVWDIDDGGTDVDEACFNLGDDANSNFNTPNFVAWDRNYDFACQWPGGNIDFYVEGYDEDCADACIGGGFASVVSDYACAANVNRKIRNADYLSA